MAIPVFQISKTHICFTLGSGLIGGQVIATLQKSYKIIENCRHTIDWQSSKSITDLLEYLFTKYNNFNIDIVWSAGKCGFAASDKEMLSEYQVFHDVIEHISQNTQKVSFNFISSAGGIYENSGYIDDINNISPSRPYAIWKLKQEEILHSYNVPSRIYRVASVYGFSHRKSRSGLINTIANNTLTNQPIIVYGNQNTLRDYILHSDIAKHVVANIKRIAKPDTQILASGRASSIQELLNIGNKLSNKKPKAYYFDNRQNSKDIIFSNRVLPENIAITSLEEGMQLLFTKMQSS